MEISYSLLFYSSYNDHSVLVMSDGSLKRIGKNQNGEFRATLQKTVIKCCSFYSAIVKNIYIIILNPSSKIFDNLFSAEKIVWLISKNFFPLENHISHNIQVV